MPHHQLTMISPAPVCVRENGTLLLDRKFAEGMKLHAQLWDGPVHCVLHNSNHPIPFGAEYVPQDLNFTLQLLEQGQPVGIEQLSGASVVAASADMIQPSDLPAICHDIGASLVMTVEYTLRSRLQVTLLERHGNVFRKLRTLIWCLTEERRRRKAMRAADAVQFNGYPAQQAYSGISKDGLLYLDGRMRLNMMATPGEMDARAKRLATGAPLRIVHSGRLAPMKGAQDLLPVAVALRRLNASFTMDIFGTGELETEIADGIARADLGDVVRLHAPVDFERELVPYLRTSSDIFLSCHRQSDPSCTYLESLGCGLPVIGYDNLMWQAMARESDAGWLVPMGKTDLMAAQLAALSRTPAAIAEKAANALEFSRLHDFETEFALRMRHLARHRKT